jgi:hypothetical protein
VDTCTEGTPSAEVCDNLDNNCDGAIDDNLTRGTTCGEGECAGNTGVETCSAGAWGGDTCDPLGGSTPEVCDGVLDEDCDGTVDEGCGTDCTDGETRSCGSDVGECKAGTETCVGGQWSGVCEGEIGPSAEVCDNLDNNCDGAIDDNLTRGTTCGEGECSGNTGIETCTAGVWGGDTCDPFDGATPEVCDDAGTLDEDCDGLANNNDPECGTQCSDYNDKHSCKNDQNCKWDNQQGVCIDRPSECTPTQEGPPGDPTCSDGSDNDCDDLIDGNDPDCNQTENNCFDGVDDDSDGLTDCADSDCDGAIGAPTSCGLGECSGNSGNLICQGGSEVDTCGCVTAYLMRTVTARLMRAAARNVRKARRGRRRAG